MSQNTTTAAPYKTSTVGAEEYVPFIVDGAAVGEVHWIRNEAAGANDTLLVGLWRSEPTTVPYFFGEDETIHALEGELQITLDSGEVITLTPGDIASFDKGTTSTWTVVSPFKKLFVISG